MAFIDELKQEVAEACNIIGRQHLTRETNGHVSARIPNSNLVLIKGRGREDVALTFAEQRDLAIVDMDGKLVEGREGLASPAEVYIHTCIYKARPEINSAIHIHPPSVVAYTIAGKPLLPIIGAYNPSGLKLITDGLPTYESSVLINTEQRGNDLVKTMGTAKACLMRGHGITTAGCTVEEAVLTAIHLNDLAELHFKADLLGGARAVSDEDLADFGARGPVANAVETLPRQHGPEWRYFQRLVQENR